MLTRLKKFFLGAFVCMVGTHFLAERFSERRSGFLSDMVFVKLNYTPSPTTSSSTTPLPSQETTQEAIPNSCSCSVAPFQHNEKYQSQLNSSVSWLNLTTMQELEKHHPNFPLSLVKNHGNKWCKLLPFPHAINWNNIYYQSVQVSNTTTFFLYSAFFDNRVLADVRPCIRILTYTRAKHPTKPWCYTWFNSTGPPAVAEANRVEYLGWQGVSDSRQMTFAITCPVPQTQTMPLAVSVVAKPCEKARTLLQVTGAMERNSSTAFVGGDSQPRKNGLPRWNVAVCGPPLYYYQEDFSWRLVEWMEILRAQGVAKVFLGQTDVHPNIEKVLRYYEEDGFLSVTRFSYPEPYANDPNVRRLWYLIELPKRFALQDLYYSDCILRHMHEYRFIAHFDPDEVPMLIKFDTLLEWLTDGLRRVKIKPGEEAKQPPAHKFAWYYHNNDIQPPPSGAHLPEYVWAMRHAQRAKTPTDLTPGKFKPVFDMDLVMGGFSHDVLNCAYGKCRSHSVSYPRDEAYLGHFNYLCEEDCRSPNSTVEETALLKYKDRVVPAVERVLKELHLL